MNDLIRTLAELHNFVKPKIRRAHISRVMGTVEHRFQDTPKIPIILDGRTLQELRTILGVDYPSKTI